MRHDTISQNVDDVKPLKCLPILADLVHSDSSVSSQNCHSGFLQLQDRLHTKASCDGMPESLGACHLALCLAGVP